MHTEHSVASVLVVITAMVGSSCVRIANPVNEPGHPSTYVPVDSPGTVSGLGIEPQDIVAATDQMVRDILACKEVVRLGKTPRIVIDSRYFENQSSQSINKNLFTDRLRTELNRVARGRLVFLARQHANMVEDERTLEERGVVTPGARSPTSPALGWDFRLGGRIASLDAYDPRTGKRQRYYQITFELVERGSGILVWSKMHEFRKVGQDSIIYR